MANPHKPYKLPVKFDIARFSNELTSASFELGKLDGLQRNLPNPQILISPLLVKEATISSRIEGTRSTISDVLEYEATGKPKHPDTVEVSNYKRAMVLAIEELKNLPINTSFIKRLHQILLENTRGHVTRGKFRGEQVWIGKEGDPIEKATYIPPEPLFIQDYMENLEKYFLENGKHPLLKIGIIHYQFEAIHPFKDGNGRIGRLLIPLYLYWKKLLYQPALYISGYFEKNRNSYIDELNRVDVSRKYEDWLKFFLISVKDQAEETQKLIAGINSLRNQIETRVEDFKSPYMHKIIHFIFSKPIFISSNASKTLRIEDRTIRRLLVRLVESKILTTTSLNGPRKRIYIFGDLIKLLSYK